MKKGARDATIQQQRYEPTKKKQDKKETQTKKMWMVYSVFRSAKRPS